MLLIRSTRNPERDLFESQSLYRDGAEFLPGRGVPDGRGLVRCHRNDAPAVRAEDAVFDELVVRQGKQFLPGHGVPDRSRFVPTCGHDFRAVGAKVGVMDFFAVL